MSRRKHARPSEIVEAAWQVFDRKGYAAATLDDIANTAGVAKGTLYLYFASKQDLFRAVVQDAVSIGASALERARTEAPLPFIQLVPRLLHLAIQAFVGTRAAGTLRLVIAESRAFPDVAQTLRDDMIAPLVSMLSSAVCEAQDRGELKNGDPTMIAYSIVGPLAAAWLVGEVIEPRGSQQPDWFALCADHTQTILRGLSATSS